MSKKDNSRALIRYGEVEDLYLLGCSPRTISRMTGLTVERVEKILEEIRRKQLTIRGDNNEKEM